MQYLFENQGSSMAAPRRRVLQLTTATLVGTGFNAGRFVQMLAAQQAPAAIKRDGARPAVEQGAASGDVGHDRAIIWSRCDRPAQMIVEWATTETFREPRRVMGPAAIEATDFTAKVDLRSLPAAERIFYRVL